MNKNLKVTTGILAIAFVTLTTMSCKEAKKDDTNEGAPNTEMNAAENQSAMNHDSDTKEMGMNTDQDGNAEGVLKDYFNLKDALVADNNAQAKELGATLAESLGGLEISSYTSAQKVALKDILEDAVEHAEHISESDIKTQREHFKVLSKDVTELVEITGTANTLYEQFCPMYDNGSAWLSTSKDVLNPYYGSKMLKCGKVQKEIK